MYKIIGDGSYQNTKIWRNNDQIDWTKLEFRVNVDEGCVAVVDGVHDTIDKMFIDGVYMIISDGEFTSTQLLYLNRTLHGIQWIKGSIEKDCHPSITIDAIMLPNFVEVE